MYPGEDIKNKVSSCLKKNTGFKYIGKQVGNSNLIHQERRHIIMTATDVANELGYSVSYISEVIKYLHKYENVSICHYCNLSQRGKNEGWYYNQLIGKHE